MLRVSPVRSALTYFPLMDERMALVEERRAFLLGPTSDFVPRTCKIRNFHVRAPISTFCSGENYASWSWSMKIALSAKNKFDFVDDSLPKPDASDPEKLKLWIRNNNIIISWILNVLPKDISASIIYLETTSEMWKELHEHFRQSIGRHIFQIKRNLMKVTQAVFAFNVRSNGIFSQGFNNKNPISSSSQNSPNRPSNNNYKNCNSSYYTHCKRSGHTQENFYRLHSFPPGYRFNQTQTLNRKINVASADNGGNQM
uniref:Retrotransposon Copia-like N-terminal domain-containing protein n=1 Tax=Lactuca sativa TaxID=4236 RepID=A0A9R1VJQ1_LACSA|nr:hypothetical protein LSAT_V11C500253400 [Lactuca sativa]